MAKKQAGVAKRKQKVLEGDGFSVRLPKAVQTAIEEYLTAKRDAAEASESAGEAKVRLIDIAHKNNLTRIKIEGENKFIEVGIKDTVKVKTVPKDQRKQAGQED